MTDGIIELDSEAGKAIGFTSSDFMDGSYLWKSGEVLSVSFIWSKRRGAFRELVQRMLADGLTVHVPTPLGRMQEIVRKAGYVELLIEDPEMGPVEVWEMKPEPVGAT